MVAFLLLFFPFATARTPAETLRLPGCHLAADDSSRVECDNRAVVQLNDTVYEANGGVVPRPLDALHVPLLRRRRGILRRLARQAHDRPAGGHRRPATASGSRGRSSRWVLFAVDGPLSFFLCGIITSSVSRGHRRLGDMAASTYVVGRDDAGRDVVFPRTLTRRS